MDARTLRRFGGALLVVPGLTSVAPMQSTSPTGPVGPGNVTARYATFGEGCAGSEGGEGFVLPRAARDAFGRTQTEDVLSFDRTRMQQVFGTEELSTPQVLTGLAFRYDDLMNSSEGRVHLVVRVGCTTRTPATLDTGRGWDANFDIGYHAVVHDGWLDLPERGPTKLDPSAFLPSVVFARPMPVIVGAGRQLLIEVSCLANRGGLHFVDAVLQEPTAATTTTLWGPVDHAKPEQQHVGFGPVLRLRCLNDSPSAPRLAAIGRPLLGRSFAVFVHDARRSAPGLLLSGFSNERFGPLSLPHAFGPLAASCTALCSWDFALPIQTDGDGYAVQLVVLPNEPKLAGLRLYQQFLIVDPGAPHGFALSQGGEALVGDI